MTAESPAPPPAPAPAPPAAPPTPPPPPPRSPFAWTLWCAAAAVALVVAYFGYHWFTYRLSHSITDDAFVEAHIVNVAPEMVSGRIVRFLVEENELVNEGQVLAVVEPVHYQDQVEAARGKLELAEAELKRQEAGLTKVKNEIPLQIDVAEKSVTEAQAAIALAKANTTLARLEFERFTKLASEDATTIRKAEEVTYAHLEGAVRGIQAGFAFLSVVTGTIGVVVTLLLWRAMPRT